MQYRIHIHNREYTEWTIYDNETGKEAEGLREMINPIEHRFFTNDIFTFSQPESTNESNSDPPEKPLTEIHSQIKSGVVIAGVLFIDKVYGKTAKKSLYKCIPDDIHLPCFLIPYQPKIEFSKKPQNKYVIFKYDHWQNTHPQGTLLNTIGNIDELPAFYEYQLFCKSLHVSITNFTTRLNERLHNTEQSAYIKQILETPQYNICDRRKTHRVFSIDPIGSQDFDDAFSIEKTDSDKYTVSVYIANVYMWLETLNLWSSFSDRVATIYLPDKKRPMLPTILSDSLCSLQQGETRFAFTMDTDFAIVNGKCIQQGDIRFSNTAIAVCKNFVYDHIHNFTPYETLFDLTQKLDSKVADSHDMVAFWMIFMNTKCGNFAEENQTGIFRSVVHYSPDIPVKIENAAARRVIEQWGNTSGQYVVYDPTAIKPVEHQIMKLRSYIHITSPIRRLVDLLNLIQISEKCGIISPTQSCANFVAMHLQKMDYINQSMRLIRKIQTDCELIDRCSKTPELIKKTHRGILFDKTERNDGRFTYMVYLEEVGLLSRIHLYESIDNYCLRIFRMFIFDDEVNRKIRLQMVE
jgi:exoribonuclease R